MRYGIFSDIHANREALEAVLDALRGARVERFVCLGDVVGYGPEPCACLEIVREVADVVVVGNHDLAAVEKVDIEFFNRFAREASVWTREQLGGEAKAWIEALPLTLREEGVDFVHGALYAPELFDYVQTSYDAFLSFEAMTGRVCFLGHSHVPVAFAERELIVYRRESRFVVEEGERAIVNVGSVGQPRDGDPRAGCVIFDAGKGSVEFVRAAYDIGKVARKIERAGLPIALGERLVLGR